MSKKTCRDWRPTIQEDFEQATMSKEYNLNGRYEKNAGIIIVGQFNKRTLQLEWNGEIHQLVRGNPFS